MIENWKKIWNRFKANFLISLQFYRILVSPHIIEVALYVYLRNDCLDIEVIHLKIIAIKLAKWEFSFQIESSWPFIMVIVSWQNLYNQYLRVISNVFKSINNKIVFTKKNLLLLLLNFPSTTVLHGGESRESNSYHQRILLRLLRNGWGVYWLYHFAK